MSLSSFGKWNVTNSIFFDNTNKNYHEPLMLALIGNVSFIWHGLTFIIDQINCHKCDNCAECDERTMNVLSIDYSFRCLLLEFPNMKKTLHKITLITVQSTTESKYKRGEKKWNTWFDSYIRMLLEEQKLDEVSLLLQNICFIHYAWTAMIIAINWIVNNVTAETHDAS